MNSLAEVLHFKRTSTDGLRSWQDFNPSEKNINQKCERIFKVSILVYTF